MDYASITSQSHLDVLFPLHSVVESVGTDKFCTASKPPQISQEASERTEADPIHWSPLRLLPERPDSPCRLTLSSASEAGVNIMNCGYLTVQLITTHLLYNAVSLMAFIQCSSADSDSVSRISVLCTLSLPTFQPQACGSTPWGTTWSCNKRTRIIYEKGLLCTHVMEFTTKCFCTLFCTYKFRKKNFLTSWF